MEQEFDLSKAVSGQTKAMADRDFYMSMVAQNTPGASPLAAYLAGMASAKASQYEGQIQADKDARDAASKALKRQDALRNTVYQIMGDVSTGKMQPSAAAMILEPTMKELGYRMIEYDADGGVATFADAEGEEYELTMDQVPDKYKIISQEGQTERAKIQAQARKEVAQIQAGSKKETTETKAKSAEKIAERKAESAAEVARINAQARIDATKLREEARKNRQAQTSGGSRSANATTTLNAWAREFEEAPFIDEFSYPTSDLQAALDSIESAPEQWKKENASRIRAKIYRVLAERGVEETTVFD